MLQEKFSVSCVALNNRNNNQPKFWFLAVTALSVGLMGFRCNPSDAVEPQTAPIKSQTLIVCPDGYRSVRVTTEIGTPILLENAVIEFPTTSAGQTCVKVRS